MIFLLGIYKYKEFSKRLASRKYAIYDDFCDLYPNRFVRYKNEINVIKYGMHISKSIHFMLDGVKTPLNSSKSFTCLELELIFNNLKFLNKTIFYYKGEIIPTDFVKLNYFIN